MSWLTRGTAKLRYLLTRSDANREFDEELQANADKKSQNEASPINVPAL